MADVAPAVAVVAAGVLPAGAVPVLLGAVPPVDDAPVPVVLPATVDPVVDAFVEDAVVERSVVGAVVDGTVEAVVGAVDPASDSLSAFVLATVDMSHRFPGGYGEYADRGKFDQFVLYVEEARESCGGVRTTPGTSEAGVTVKVFFVPAIV